MPSLGTKTFPGNVAQGNAGQVSHGNSSRNFGAFLNQKLLQSACDALTSGRHVMVDRDYEINEEECQRLRVVADGFRKTFCSTVTTQWSVEYGESSRLQSVSESSSGAKLVLTVKSAEHVIRGRMVIDNPARLMCEKRPPNKLPDYNLEILKNFPDMPAQDIKSQYCAPYGYTKLSDIDSLTIFMRICVIGVVTEVIKSPKNTGGSRYHSMICISDPSLMDKDGVPSEFKMHLFFSRLSDFREVHAGDVISFLNVKVEKHESRFDGRIFAVCEMKTYCYNDINVPLPHRNINNFTTVCLLHKWFESNWLYFDYLTPRTLQNNYAISSPKRLQHAHESFVFDLYCQVVSLTTAGRYHILQVWDGTIFSFEKLSQPTTTDGNRNRAEDGTPRAFGCIAIIALSKSQFNHLLSLKVDENDFLMLCHVTARSVSQQVLVSSEFTQKYPCMMLSVGTKPFAECITKVPSTHHEAISIKCRLARMVQVLEQMDSWVSSNTVQPEEEVEPDPEEPVRVEDPEIQADILRNFKRLKRS